jgi:hypothetical protein
MSGEWVAVEEVEDTGEWETVYNLRVADFHTYFVGCDEWGFSVWAHNADYAESATFRKVTGLSEGQSHRAIIILNMKGEAAFIAYAEKRGLTPTQISDGLTAAKQAAAAKNPPVGPSVLDPNQSVRDQCYPSRVQQDTRARCEGASEVDGVLRCQNPQCETPGGRVLNPGEGFIQHDPPLHVSHNLTGWDSTNQVRIDIFNRTANNVWCETCQKAEGGQMHCGPGYRRDTGPNFLPRPRRSYE